MAPELAKFDQVLPKAKSVVDSIEVLDDEGERQAWQFDPATGAQSLVAETPLRHYTATSQVSRGWDVGCTHLAEPPTCPRDHLASHLEDFISLRSSDVRLQSSRTRRNYLPS